MIRYSRIHVVFRVPADQAEEVRETVASQFSSFLENELTYENRVPEGLYDDAEAEDDFNQYGNAIKVEVEHD